MNSNLRSLARIARHVSQNNPILGYELEQAVLSYAADQKPKSFDTEFESASGILKKLQEKLKGLEGVDSDSEEFIEFFDSGADELRGLIESRKASRVAAEDDGIEFLEEAQDWLKEFDELAEEPSQGGVKKLLDGVSGLTKKAPAKGKGDKKPSSDEPSAETKQLMKELFRALNPLPDTEANALVTEMLNDLESRNASTLPILVRIAFEKPEYRPILLPFIKRISSLPAKVQRTASLNALKTIVKRANNVA